MRFEWDPAKDTSNRAKHRLSFEEATELFKSGVDYMEIYDEEHSDEEDRFMVAYTERDEDILRILSARMATTKERQRFEAWGGERHER
jgi:hypothetical protein